MSVAAPIRIAVICEDEFLRQALVSALQTDGTMSVAGWGRDYFPVDDEPVDAVLYQLGRNPEALQGIRELSSRVPVVVRGIDSELTVAAIRAGARGFVSEHSTSALVKQALEMSVAGQCFLDAPAASHALEALRAPPRERSKLTKREFEVLARMVALEPPRTIARELNISLKTVFQHEGRIRNKLGVSSRSEAIALGRALLNRTQKI